MARSTSYVISFTLAALWTSGVSAGEPNVLPKLAVESSSEELAVDAKGLCSPEAANTPLRKAVRLANVSKTRRLVRNGANINEVSQRGTVLTYYNRCEFLTGSDFRELGEAHYRMIGEVKNLGFNFGRFGDDVIESTIGTRYDQRLIETLIDAGALVGDGTTTQAMRYGHYTLLEWLLDHGADVHSKELWSSAVREVRYAPQYLTLLLTKGATGPDDPVSRQSVRLDLVYANAIEPLSRLLSIWPTPSSCVPNDDSQEDCEESLDLLERALEHHRLEAIEILHANGVRVTNADRNGYTRLHSWLSQDSRARSHAEERGKPPPPLPTSEMLRGYATIIRLAPDVLSMRTRWNDTPSDLARHPTTAAIFKQVKELAETSSPNALP